MAELFGVITGVLGLLPLCRDALGCIKDILDVSKAVETTVGRLELQRDRYDEWRDIWKHEVGEKDIRFETWAKSNPAAARSVLHQLALLSKTLLDARTLEDQYGFMPALRPDRESKDLGRFKLREGESLTIETQALFLERCQINFMFMKRFKFVLRKSDQTVNSLIDRIKGCNETLAKYGPKLELQKLIRAEFELLRKLNHNELIRRAEAAAYEAKHSLVEYPEIKNRYHDITLAAQFSEVVKYERQHSASKFTMRDFRLDKAYLLSSSDSSTMALLFDYPVRKEHRVVLIEWIASVDRDQERDTRIKSFMLATPKPGQLLLPTCYGVVEDPITRRFGLVLAPPAHIRSNLPQILPSGAISQKRMPVSLLELLEKRHPSCVHLLDLGTRFQLAKKLVDAIHMMHCVGWIHKNIRSNSILFFPAKNIPSRGPPGPASGVPQPLGYDEPIFVGYGKAQIDLVDARSVRQHPKRRPDDIHLDYYQHPEKRWNPKLVHSRSHDIYSLGCVLLEIGLWKPIHQIVDIEDEDFERTKQAFQALTMKLDGLTGAIYADIVRKCLAVNIRERTETEVRELSSFCTEIATSLAKCWA